jgi:hypothetical protein
MSSDSPWRAASLSSSPLGLLHRRGAFMSSNIPSMSFEQLTLKRRRSVSSSLSLNLWSFYELQAPNSGLTPKRTRLTPHPLSSSRAFMSSALLGTFCLWVPSLPWKEEGPRPLPRPCWRRLHRTRRDTCPWERHLARGRVLKVLINPLFKTIITEVGIRHLIHSRKSHFPTTGQLNKVALNG